MAVSVVLPPLRTRTLFEVEILVDPPHDVGGPAGAARRIGHIPGGTFAGERLRGRVLSGGSDWQTLRSDGAVLLDARLLLKTDDGALIGMTYTGVRHGPPAVIARLAHGEPVSPEDYYFRIVPCFVTSDPRYEWLNRIVAVGSGHRELQGPLYRIDEIL